MSPATSHREDLDLPRTPWADSATGVAEALAVDVESGLSTDEVDRRRERYGANRLREEGRTSLARILWHQVGSLITVLLLGAMVASLLFGQVAEAVAIAVVLVANATIGTVTELRAARAMESLREMGQAEAKVRREGGTSSVAARTLVPGDVVLLREGDVVGGDLRLVTVDRLEIDESALTGESVPVRKSTEPVERDAAQADRTPMAYRGTVVRRGEGTGVVVATGMNTALGEISSMVARAESGQAPLDERLDRLARRLVWLTLAVAAGVVFAGVQAGRELQLMVETGVALAVAAIPEGLPIVATVALARGMHRMMERNALVRRLSAVETLGSTTVVCTDKTGTLTENRMAVRRVETPAGEGDPGEMDGPEELSPAVRTALTVAVLANEAEGQDSGGEDAREDEGEGEDEDEDGGREAGRHEATGDPLELALLRMGRTLGMSRERLRERHPEERRVGFDRETQMMATVHRSGEGGTWRVAVKGAPEAVIDVCDRVSEPGVEGPDGDGADAEPGEGPLDASGRARWRERSDALAAEGLRVLALADKPVDDPAEEPYEGLRLLGLVGLVDPPRDGVRPALARCREAGIRVVMVTGDHPETARYVARELGLGDDDGSDLRVVTGDQLTDGEDWDEGLRERLLEAQVVARVDPEEKMRLVELHQGDGAILAMTGDGVNDAPALRSADIGIAMGRRGTEVAREAADVVLLDDAFATIVSAVEEGRTIFRNVRRFVVYLLSGNVGEIVAVGAAAVASLPLPLLPLQILYLNLVNDVFPSLALGVGPSEPDLMDGPPRDPEEGIMDAAHWGVTVGYGLMIAGVVLGVLLTGLNVLGLGEAEAVTVSFLALSLGRLTHVFNMRDAADPPFRNEVTRNPLVWAALALCLGLLAVALFVPPLPGILHLVVPGAAGWGLAVGGALTVPLLGQLGLAASRLLARSRA